MSLRAVGNSPSLLGFKNTLLVPLNDQKGPTSPGGGYSRKFGIGVCREGS